MKFTLLDCCTISIKLYNWTILNYIIIQPVSHYLIGWDDHTESCVQFVSGKWAVTSTVGLCVCVWTTNYFFLHNTDASNEQSVKFKDGPGNSLLQISFCHFWPSNWHKVKWSCQFAWGYQSQSPSCFFCWSLWCSQLLICPRWDYEGQGTRTGSSEAPEFKLVEVKGSRVNRLARKIR